MPKPKPKPKGKGKGAPEKPPSTSVGPALGLLAGLLVLWVAMSSPLGRDLTDALGRVLGAHYVTQSELGPATVDWIRNLLFR